MGKLVNQAVSLEFVRELARLAGTEITRIRSMGKLNVSFKGIANLVTDADVAAERLITAAVRERFPDHAILAEETAAAVSDPEVLRGPLWIIDPIDGTTNYAHGHHHAAVSIAFADRGQVQLGVVLCPFENEEFAAARGHGATLNGEPIAVRPVDDLEHALIATGFPHDKRERLDSITARVRAVLKTCRDLRRYGAASLDLCWVACGRLDGYYESIQPWDLAAGGLIAREAGAVMSRTALVADSPLPEEIDGREVLLASPGISKALCDLLRAAG